MHRDAPTERRDQRLNAAQDAAARVGGGCHLVLAGPGTGKTTTLVARFAHLLASGVPADRILCATFTRAAADEMRARLRALTGGGTDPAWIGTFHSLSLRLLGPLLGGARVIESGARWRLLSRLRIRWRGGGDESLLDVIDGAKERLLDPTGFRADLERQVRAGNLERTDPLFEAATHFEAYQRALERETLVDFGDLILRVVRECAAHGPEARTWRSRFRHVLVDEYQDVNPAQLAWIEGMRAEGGPPDLWCVGDDDQCLYAFRSADPRLILAFPERHPGAVLHRLDRTYRSTPQILALAGAVIAQNRARFDKPLTPQVHDGPKPVVHPFPDGEAEARWVAEGVEKLLARGDDPSGIALLVRSGALAAPLQRALVARRIACVVHGAEDFWSSRCVRAFRAVLVLTERPQDRAALEELGPELAAAAEGTRPAAGAPWSEVLEAAYQALRKPPRGVFRQKAQEWWDTLSAVKSLARRAGSLAGLEALAEEDRRLASEGAGGASVTISTVHRAKGLEWDTVFVVGAEDRQYPHALSEDEEEERRILYVAITRARRRLILSYAARRGEVDGAGPSPFLLRAVREVGAAALDWRGGVPASGGGAAAAAGPRARPSDSARAAKPPGLENSGKAWGEAEEDRLRAAFATRASLDTLAAEFRRSPGGIAARLVHLGLMEPGGYTEARYRELTGDLARWQAGKLQDLAVARLGGLTEAAGWLATPHAAFGGRAPKDCLDDPDLLRRAALALPPAEAAAE